MTTTRAISTLAEHGYQVNRTPNHFEVTGGGKTEIISEQQLVDMARGIEPICVFCFKLYAAKYAVKCSDCDYSSCPSCAVGGRCPNCFSEYRKELFEDSFDYYPEGVLF